MASSQCGTFIYSGAQMRGRSDTFYTYIASECEQFLRALTSGYVTILNGTLQPNGILRWGQTLYQA